MRKSKFLVGSVILALGLMGTGYAAWADVLGVQSSVNTGEFGVGFTSSTVFEVSEGGQRENASVTAAYTADWASIQLEKMYPGYQAQARFDIQNEGDIAATLEGIELARETTVDSELAKYLEVRTYVADANGNCLADSGHVFGEEYVSIAEFDEYVGTIESATADTELDLTNDKQTLMVEVRLSEDTPVELQNQDAKLFFAVDYKQFNMK